MAILEEPVKVQKIQNHLNFLADHGHEFLLSNAKAVQNEAETVKYCARMIVRFIHISEGLSALFKENTNVHQLDYCAGIILRSALLDTQQVLNLYLLTFEYTAATQNDYRIQADNYCFDTQKYGVKHFVDFFKNDQVSTYLTKDLMEQTMAYFKVIYKRFFENGPDADGKYTMVPTRYFKQRLSNKTMEKELLKDLPARVNILYLIYSKYDHYSDVSWTVMGHPIATKLLRIEEGLEFVTWGYYCCLAALHDYLYPNNNEIGLACKSALTYLESNVSSFKTSSQ